MATNPAQPRTPRRRAGAPAADAAPTPADATPAVSATEAPGAKPAAKSAAAKSAAAKSAAKSAAKPARKTAAKTAAKPARKTAAEAAPKAEAEVAPAAAEPAVADPAPARRKATKPAAKAPAKRASAEVKDATPAEVVAEAATAVAPAPETAAKKVAAKKVAAKKVAAKKAAAKKVVAKKAATKASARKPVKAPADLVPAAEAEPDAAASAGPAAPVAVGEPGPAPARKRSSRKTVATPAVVADGPAAIDAPAEVAAEVPPPPAARATSAEAGDSVAEATGRVDDAPDAPEGAEAVAAEEADDGAVGSPPEAGAAPARERSRRNRRRGRDRDRAERTAEAPASARATGDEPASASNEADTLGAEPLPAIEAPAEAPTPVTPPAPAVPTRPPRPAPSGPAHSTLQCLDGDQRRIVWHTGHTASDGLYFAAQDRLGADGLLADDDDDDDSLTRLLRQAADEGHRVEIDPAVWAQLAARRDARTRAGVLMAAYPDGPASAGLARLLTVPLPLYQAEGALWAVVAGRGLLADERGLGKSVQAIAAAQLWRRHFGVRRIAVISGAGERLAWQRAWRRFAGVDAQVMEGGLHQRQALWSQPSEVRILAPEALSSDAAHLAHWAPELVIVDEPQRLGLDGEAWAALDEAPQALVLCGAALDDQPALLESLVAWLDRDRLGAYAALREVQAAREGRATLDDAGVERVSDALSRCVLQRQRAEVADQLPRLVYSERVVPLAPAQREVHDRLVATLRRSLGGWQASGYLSDTDQWRLATTLRAALAACHRADPSVADGPLAEAVVQAAADQLRAWASDAGADASPQVLLLCDTEADLAQLNAALAARGLLRDGLQLALAGQPVTLAADAVLQVGVPWRTRRAALLPAGAAADAAAGQQWLLLVAQDSLEAALFDTLAGRTDVPRGAADPGGHGFLQGERLLAWLQAIQAALQAMPAAQPPVGQVG